MREHGWDGRRSAAATGRSARHHPTRKFAAALGSRADRLPPGVQRAISLEGTVAARPPAPTGAKPTLRRDPSGAGFYQPVLELARDGVVPLLDPVVGMSQREHLHIAVVIPPFRRGSGGHSTIYNLLTRLEERGHTVSTWLHDPMWRHRNERPALIRGNLREYFRPVSGPVFKGFDQWFGADVALATGWDTVFPVQRLPHCRARAYLVQDHEPEFFATSAESVFAERTYVEGLYCIAASPWLLELVHSRYGAEGSSFVLGVDHEAYRPRPVERRRDTVIFYAREATPRRAVPLGVLALQELQRRRPDVRFVFFGNDERVETPFGYDDLGVASSEQLSWAYSEATVGLSLSLTNYSLIPQEMLACGLPCVDLAGRAIESVYGPDGPIELANADPVAIADALELLLGDPGLRERRSRAGIEFVAEHTWDRASHTVEAALRDALRGRETAPPPPGDLVAPLVQAVPRSWAESARAIAVDRPTTQEATDRLYARLDADDIEAVVEELDPAWRSHWDAVDDARRRTLALVFGAWFGVESVLRKTGLTAAQPPEDVHAMARGPLAGGGSFYYADMLAESLRRVGTSLEEVQRGLDFGCSSGRTVRALHAAYPDTQWSGVDPNEGAIAWAQEHLPGIEFAVSPQDPPLDYADGTFDFVVAISIWSHYAEPAAIRWLAEMHRIIRPGGHLVFSTHGPHSVSYYGQTGERTPTQLAQIRRALYQRGYWFAPEFGEAGDWGVVHSEWGTAFFTPEWLARVALPQWSIEDFAVGQNADNQDVYVLRRR
jgi:glycosyltransferase involved in cell wall biosynthesis/SAM-dependent methyltransferase